MRRVSIILMCFCVLLSNGVVSRAYQKYDQILVEETERYTYVQDWDDISFKTIITDNITGEVTVRHGKYICDIKITKEDGSTELRGIYDDYSQIIWYDGIEPIVLVDRTEFLFADSKGILSVQYGRFGNEPEMAVITRDNSIGLVVDTGEINLVDDRIVAHNYEEFNEYGMPDLVTCYYMDDPHFFQDRYDGLLNIQTYRFRVNELEKYEYVPEAARKNIIGRWVEDVNMTDAGAIYQDSSDWTIRYVDTREIIYSPGNDLRVSTLDNIIYIKDQWDETIPLKFIDLSSGELVELNEYVDLRYKTYVGGIPHFGYVYLDYGMWHMFLTHTGLLAKNNLAPKGSVQVRVDTDYVEYSEELGKPCIVEDRAMIPLRGIVMSLGGETFWDEEKKGITIKRKEDTIILKVGEKAMMVNDTEVVMDIAPMLIEGRTYVPVRFIAEAFGLVVSYDNEHGFHNIGIDPSPEEPMGLFRGL